MAALTVARISGDRFLLGLGASGPQVIELTGELADGWLGTSFVPERADAFLSSLRSGAKRAGRTLDEIDVCQHAEVRIGDNVEALIEDQRRRLAFYLGGMGTASRNFYQAAYVRQGYADVAAAVQALWVDGDHDAAVAAVPDELVLATNLIGDQTMIRHRARARPLQGRPRPRPHRAATPRGAQRVERGDGLGAVGGGWPGRGGPRPPRGAPVRRGARILCRRRPARAT